MVILGFEPELQRPNAETEKDEPLFLHNTTLNRIGEHIKPDPNEEIDQFLRFCQREFRGEDE